MNALDLIALTSVINTDIYVAAAACAHTGGDPAAFTRALSEGIHQLYINWESPDLPNFNAS